MAETTRGSGGLAAPAVGIVVGIVLVILGQFFLDHLADTSDTWHFVQHGVLFVGGLAIGVSGTLLWVSSQGRA